MAVDKSRNHKERPRACPQSLIANRSLYFGYPGLIGAVPFKNLNVEARTKLCVLRQVGSWLGWKRRIVGRDFDPDYRLHFHDLALSRMIYSLRGWAFAKVMKQLGSKN